MPPLGKRHRREQTYLRAQKRERVAEHGREFALSGNALYAWSAIAECCAEPLELPPWLRKYLSGVAQTLARMTVNVPPKGTIAPQVATALRLNAHGRFNAFRAFNRRYHDTTILIAAVNYQREHCDLSLSQLFAAVARKHRCQLCTGVRARTVKDIWYRNNSKPTRRNANH